MIINFCMKHSILFEYLILLILSIILGLATKKQEDRREKNNSSIISLEIKTNINTTSC